MQAQIPQIKADLIEQVRRIYAYRLSLAPEGIPAHPGAWDNGALVITETLRPVCDVEKAAIPGAHLPKAKLIGINEAKLEAYAQAQAEAAAVEWEAKINAKLGTVESVEVIHGRGPNFQIRAVRAGQRVTLDQQRTLNVSPKGRLFNQFPARLYVDGKFKSQAAYVKHFA